MAPDSPHSPPSAPPLDARSALIRRSAVAVLFVAASVGLYLTAGDYASIEALRANQAQLHGYVADHAALAVLTFMAVFVLYAATSIPGIIALKMIGGLLFGSVPATLLIMVGMTVGGAISFLMARYVLTDLVRSRTGDWAARLEAGFKRNAWSYMFILRLLPIVPYFAVNIVPALLRVPLRIFLVTTFIGTIPNTYIYTSLGASLGDALAAGPGIDPWSALMQPKVIAALVGLIGLAVLPIVYQRFTRS